MKKFKYATSPDYTAADCVVFGVNTKCAGTAPTFSTPEDHEKFSADVIRRVDNRLFSLPENFQQGDHLWDDGNLSLDTHSVTYEVAAVSQKFLTILQDKKIPICLGGDHIIKFAGLAAVDQFVPEQYGVVYLDAHPDCEQKEGISYSTILHQGFLQSSLKPRQVMLTGIRQFTVSEVESLKTYQPEIGIIKGSEFSSTSMQQILEKIIAQFSGLKYLYFSIDLDGLNPSCAPGVESPYPGGPNLNQVIYLLQQLRSSFNYIGMDISEFIPKLDQQHTTALSAARIMKEFYSMV